MTEAVNCTKSLWFFSPLKYRSHYKVQKGKMLYKLMDLFIFFYYYYEKKKKAIYHVTAILRHCSQACQTSSKIIKKETCQMEARTINKKIKIFMKLRFALVVKLH